MASVGEPTHLSYRSLPGFRILADGCPIELVRVCWKTNLSES